MRSLTLYYSKKSNQTTIIEEIKALSEQLDLVFIDVCIDGDQHLEERFGSDLPVVMVGPYRLNFPFTIREVEIASKATLYQDEQNLETVDDRKRFTFTNQEKFTLWFSKAYTWVISIFILVFVGISFLAPILASRGQTNKAQGLYKFYSILCHQLAYRSFFINGEQLYYPRELANIPNKLTYEEVTGMPANDLQFARGFIGNNRLGYKIALCQRDIAIYLSLGLFGIFFELTGKKMKHLSWYLWFLIALFPIAIDGFSQLPGLAQGWPTWMLARESTPLLRTMTGFLFGAGTAWYMYPLMEESIREIRFSLERKRNIVKRIAGS